MTQKINLLKYKISSKGRKELARVMKIKSLSLAALTSLAPMMALAQGQVVPLPTTNVNSITTLLGSMCTILNWVFTVLLILGILFVIVAAFRYLTASGDPEKVKKANHTLIYAAVAILVGILAKAVPIVVASLINVSLPSAC